MAKKYQSYTDEFKENIVKLYNNGKGVTLLSKEYGVASSAIYKWIKYFNNSNSFKKIDNISEDQKLLIEANKKIKQLEMENDLLKQAAILLGKR